MADCLKVAVERSGRHPRSIAPPPRRRDDRQGVGDHEVGSLSAMLQYRCRMVEVVGRLQRSGIKQLTRAPPPLGVLRPHHGPVYSGPAACSRSLIARIDGRHFRMVSRSPACAGLRAPCRLCYCERESQCGFNQEIAHDRSLELAVPAFYPVHLPRRP